MNMAKRTLETDAESDVNEAKRIALDQDEEVEVS
jgi:hypothetical protein